MSDNIAITPGTGATVATDDVSGVQYQRVKLDIGGDGVSTPVTDLATSAKQDTGNTSLGSLDTKTPALGQALAAASRPVVLTASQLSTLTPPSNTGYALDASLTTIDTDIKSNITLHAGTNLIGKVGIDQTTPGTTNLVALTAETTKAIGVTRTADGSGNLLTSTTNALDVNLKSSGLSNLSTNTAQINGVTPLMGNGVTGTGSQRVTIASDNTAFSVNSTLSAETTKVIGVVRNADGSGNLLTSTTNALDVNLKTSSITLSVSGTVTTTPPSNASTNIAQINGVTPLMGNGVTGTGSQRVTIASDNTAFSVNATLSAETTKVIGTVNQGTSPWVTNDPGLPNTLGQSNMAGSTSVAIASDQSAVTVAQATGTNLHTVLDSGTLTTLTTLTGTTTLTPGVAATNLGKAEDASHTSGDTGVFALGVRNDALGTTFTNANGDYSPLAVDLTGTLFTNVNTVPTSTDRTGSGTIAALNATVAATTNGCSTVQFTVGSLGTAQLTIEGFDGTNWNTLEGDQDATDTVESIVTQSGLVTVPCGGFSQVRLRASTYSSGTVTVSWNAGAGLALVEIFNSNGTSLRVQDLASSTPGSTAPTTAQMQGNLAKTALPTAVTDGQLVNNMGDKFGRQVVLNNAMRDIVGKQTTTISASTAETTIITAAASTLNDLLAVWISNTSATPARVDIRDATGGSIIFQLYIPAGDMRGFSLTTPWPQSTANNNWTAQSSASVTDLRVATLYTKNQ